jgi:hypothetical protein
MNLPSLTALVSGSVLRRNADFDRRRNWLNFLSSCTTASERICTLMDFLRDFRSRDGKPTAC